MEWKDKKHNNNEDFLVRFVFDMQTKNKKRDYGENNTANSLTPTNINNEKRKNGGINKIKANYMHA